MRLVPSLTHRWHSSHEESLSLLEFVVFAALDGVAVRGVTTTEEADEDCDPEVRVLLALLVDEAVDAADGGALARGVFREEGADFMPLLLLILLRLSCRLVFFAG